MTTLRIPPIVGQNIATLPDGTVDPRHAEDCGESCVSSAVQALRSVSLSPGCIRGAIGSLSGLTTAENLSWFLGRIGLHSSVESPTFDGFHSLRHHGQYMIALGQWVLPGFEHWMLAYESLVEVVSFMDPWTATYVQRGQGEFDAQYAGQAVIVAP